MPSPQPSPASGRGSPCFSIAGCESRASNALSLRAACRAERRSPARSSSLEVMGGLVHERLALAFDRGAVGDMLGRIAFLGRWLDPVDLVGDPALEDVETLPVHGGAVKVEPLAALVQADQSLG